MILKNHLFVKLIVSIIYFIYFDKEFIMEIRNLTTFVKTAELQNFTNAARELGYAQSTVTAQIQQLEEELQVQLFERIGKRIHITDAGKRFLPYAQKILLLAKQAASHSDVEAPSGTLRLGIVESLQNHELAGLLHRYRKVCPLVNVIVKASDCQTLTELLMKNELDIMYLFDTRIRHEELVSVYEASEPMYFTVPSGHPLTSNANVTLEEILAFPFMETERHLSYGWEFNHFLAQKGFTLKSCLEVGNPDIIVQLIKNGDGISWLPRYIIQDELQRNNVSVLDYQIPEITMYKQLIYHKNKWISAAMKAWIELFG